MQLIVKPTVELTLTGSVGHVEISGNVICKTDDETFVLDRDQINAMPVEMVATFVDAMFEFFDKNSSDVIAELKNFQSRKIKVGTDQNAVETLAEIAKKIQENEGERK